jgi:hypothetical protein
MHWSIRGGLPADAGAATPVSLWRTTDLAEAPARTRRGSSRHLGPRLGSRHEGGAAGQQGAAATQGLLEAAA